MPAIVDIGVRVSGAAAASRELDALGRRTISISKDVTAVTLGTSQTGAGAGAAFGGRSEFMAGQRLQSTITQLAGIDNGLTQTIAGFERLNYVAESSGMKLGEMFRKIGPGAVATAGAIFSVSQAYKAWANEANKVNSALEGAGFKSQSLLQFTASIFGFGEGNQVDPEKMAQKTIRDANAEVDVQAKLAEAIKKNPNMNAAQRAAVLDSIKDQVEQTQKFLSLQKELKDLQTTPRKVEANTIKEIDARLAELKTFRGEQTSVQIMSEQLEKAQLERKRLDVEAQNIQTGQKNWVSALAGMITGGAKLPSGASYGSREYITGTQSITEGDRQASVLREQLSKAEEQVQSLEAIRRLLENGRGIGIFSMEGAT